jgi:ABC-type transporter Mla MlaB component
VTDREDRSTPRVQPPDPDTRVIVVVVAGPVEPAQVRGMCEEVRTLLERSDADVVICDVGALVDPDVGTVDALARLALTARRLGRRVHLHRACGELQDLLTLLGLDDVVPPAADLPIEAEGQAEQREHPRRVQERVERDDLTS